MEQGIGLQMELKDSRVLKEHRALRGHRVREFKVLKE
jgi:hypothetical protein